MGRQFFQRYRELQFTAVAEDGDLLEDGGDRDRVGGGYEAAEEERHRERQTEHEGDEIPDEERGDQHPGDRQQQHRAQHEPQLTGIKPERRVEEERRQEGEEDDRRIKLRDRDQVALLDQQAAKDKRDGVGEPKPTRQDSDQGRAKQQLGHLLHRMVDRSLGQPRLDLHLDPHHANARKAATVPRRLRMVTRDHRAASSCPRLNAGGQDSALTRPR